MQMAKDEGWLGKQGSKWKTMPELMLMYRAAAFFGRLYAPDVTMGMQTTQEIADIEPKNINAERVDYLNNDNSLEQKVNEAKKGDGN